MKLYIYPTYTPSRDKSGNLYIKYFHDSFKDNDKIKVVNRFWQIGIASIAFNLDASVFIIQWVDLIPSKRFGKIQFVLFLILINLLSIMKKKIVWILHNKHAHNSKSRLVNYGMDLMACHSTCVVTHSEEGVTFFNDRYPKYRGKCHYIPHPTYASELYPAKENIYDYIIWGTISKRKNVLDFIRFAVNSNEMKSKRILIAGYCSDIEYAESIKRIIVNTPFEFCNQFFSDDQLKKLISQSKAILFTYNGESVLSSGALIYSLNFGKPIIGPNVGSFADLKDIVTTYNKFEEIPYLIVKPNKSACIQYIQENDWKKFPHKFLSLL